MGVTAEQLDAWEKQLDRIQGRIHIVAREMCDCQSEVVSDLDSRCDDIADLQKQIRLAWVDLIAREQT